MHLTSGTFPDLLMYAFGLLNLSSFNFYTYLLCSFNLFTIFDPSARTNRTMQQQVLKR